MFAAAMLGCGDRDDEMKALVEPRPIDVLLPDAVASFRRAPRLVLRAAPGAGKTTRVPAALLDAGLAGDRHVATRVARTLRRMLDDAGDVLVFLPGAAEIRRSAEALAPIAAAHALDVVTLHGDQPLDAQERALRPGPRRRVVLATNVAETALTVEGVTVVIDSGLARVARLEPRHGINVLRVQPISRAAPAQP